MALSESSPSGLPVGDDFGSSVFPATRRNTVGNSSADMAAVRMTAAFSSSFRTPSSRPRAAIATRSVSGVASRRAAPAIWRGRKPRNARGRDARSFTRKDMASTCTSSGRMAGSARASRSKLTPTWMKKTGMKKPCPSPESLVSRIPFSLKTKVNSAPARKAPKIGSMPSSSETAKKAIIRASPARMPISDGSSTSTILENW
jgi:hypothetical protein